VEAPHEEVVDMIIEKLGVYFAHPQGQAQ